MRRSILSLVAILTVALVNNSCSRPSKPTGSQTQPTERRWVYSDKEAPGVMVVGAPPETAKQFIEEYKKTAQLHAHWELGNRLLEAKQYDQAEKEFQLLIVGIEGERDSWMGHNGLLKVYEAKGQYPEAIRALEWILDHCADYAKPEYLKRLEQLKAKAAAAKNAPAETTQP